MDSINLFSLLSSGGQMQTRKGVNGDAISSPSAQAKRILASNKFRLIGIPLPGMVQPARFKSMNDIRSMASDEEDTYVTRSVSSEILNKL